MGDLSDVQKTDNVDDHVAADYNFLLGGVLRASLVNTETISATKQLTDSDYQFQVITPSGANRTVELAAEATTNHFTFIKCPTGATYDVLVKDDSGVTTYCTLDAGEFALCFPAGSVWNVVYSGDLGGTYTPNADLDGLDYALYGWDGKQNNQTGTTYSTQDSDNGKIVTLNNASAITLTVHSGVSADFNCLIVQLGAGQVTVAAGGTGAILNADSHTKLAGQYAIGSLYILSNAGTAPQVLFSGKTAA